MTERDGIKEFLNQLAERRDGSRREELEPIEKKKYFGKKSIIFLIVLLVIITVLIYGGYKVFHNYIQTRNDNPATVIAEVGKLAELPQGETPTMATVTNKEALKNQTFFKDAEIGDKVLIYKIAKRAFLYRPSTNKIIAIAPLH